MRYSGNGATSGSRRARVAYAALASVLLHGVVITVWNLQSPHVQPVQPTPRQVIEVQWISAVPGAPAPPAPQPSSRPAQTLRAQVPAKPSAVASRPSHRQAPERGAVVQMPGPAGAVALEAEGHGAQEVAADAAPTPQRPASDSGAADAPVRWSPEAVGRADRQERAWQRRHGSAPAAGAGSLPVAAPLGAALSTREWRGGDGARVAQVQGPGGGSYCVRLPSANRLPDVGAAPRVVPVTNCP